ncbi:hypothetical protein [Pseudomonas sp.]|uniref:hypothetical protein n=1 Tax=Pseudomonas sp. TaxID=306 RepID=UPI003D116ABE
MSIDYEIYLDTPLPEPLLAALGFREPIGKDPVARGVMGNEDMFTYWISDVTEDSFTREELKFLPACKLILSLNLERYEPSIAALIRVLNLLIPCTGRARFYLHNELLLLSKGADETVLYSQGSDWWDERVQHIRFPFIER